MSSTRIESPGHSDCRADAELVADALRGNPRAAERFVERMRCVARMLSAKNSSIGRPLQPADLEDLTQEVLALLWKDLERFNGTSRLETWAYGYCMRVLLSAVRERARSDQRRDRLRLGAEESTEEGEQASLDEHDDVYRCLGTLPRDEREIVELRHFGELSFEQAASQLGISPNTGKTRYYRGLCKLRHCLSRSTRQP